MKLGISAFAWTSEFGESYLHLIPEIKRMGLSAIEIPMFEPDAIPVNAIRRALDVEQLECTVCAILPSGKNPISTDPRERNLAISHLKRCIEVSTQLGARLLGGPLFAPIGYLPEHRPTDAEWRWAAEAFRAVADHLESNDLTVSIEPVNRSETFFIRTTADAVRLCEMVGSPRIGITIDTFHANIEEQSFSNAIRLSGRRLKHIHASENDRGPLGRGHVPFAEIVESLSEIGYSGYLMIEGFGYLTPETKSPGTLWAYLDVTPEALALESAEYLRRILGQQHSRL